MNILLTGASGQLGTELIPLLSRKGRLTVTDRQPPAHAGPERIGLDVTDDAAVDTMLDEVRPELIVNAAAYTAVDRAQEEPDIAFAVNGAFPGQLARWASLNDALLIHYSTDYVFDGSSTAAYEETDATGPLNVYGESKLAGEQAIAASACRHSILRTSWVYSSHGNNFLLSMLKLARRGIALKVVDDQRGCPTWAGSLAAASNTLIDHWFASNGQACNGVFHYCDDRAVSWYEFAGEIFRQAVRDGVLDSLPQLAPIPGSAYPQPATRPAWSVLNTGKIRKVFNIRSASFEKSLCSVISQISEKGFQ
jgi:dTDP-4-dehydrorhamnose reductase